MRFGTTFVAILAILVGGMAVLFARAILSRRPADSGPTATVVLAATPMNFGAVLSKDNLVEAPWPSNSVPVGAFSKVEDLTKEGQRIALTQIAKNEPILPSKITAPGQKASLSTLIEPGMRAVTVRVDDVRGVAGFVMPGDRVDVALTRAEQRSGKQESFTDVLLQNVKVLAIDQQANERQERAQVAKAVTLEVTAEQGQKLVLASGAGSLSLILREAGGGQTSNNPRRVSLIDLEGEQPATDEAPPSAPQTTTVRVIKRSTVEEVAVPRQGGE